MLRSASAGVRHLGWQSHSASQRTQSKYFFNFLIVRLFEALLFFLFKTTHILENRRHKVCWYCYWLRHRNCSTFTLWFDASANIKIPQGRFADFSTNLDINLAKSGNTEAAGQGTIISLVYYADFQAIKWSNWSHGYVEYTHCTTYFYDQKLKPTSLKTNSWHIIDDSRTRCTAWTMRRTGSGLPAAGRTSASSSGPAN